MEQVWIKNPNLPGTVPVLVDKAAFEGAWQERGFEIVDDPNAAPPAAPATTGPAGPPPGGASSGPPAS